MQMDNESLADEYSKKGSDDNASYKKEDLAVPSKRSTNAPREPPLQIYESYGYDCRKRANIQMIDANTVVFASGNFVNMFDVTKRTKRYMRSIGGYGIGHITLHPSAEFFAVAEKGLEPNIFIYDCSTLEIQKILRGGADYGYAFITFNPNGVLLASLATDPDYTLTVWNWEDELIILKSKAFYNDVYVVAFSQFTPGFLTTGGIGHIKFWKMAKTFTGLKLQGIIGRFGRTEVSTIEGVIQFPDGKVLSGSEWGNMLVWDADLIKVELIRRMGKFCHTAPIIQFLFEEGEILSVGCDGFIKVWQFEIMDAADSTDGKGFFEIEPLNELRVGTDVRLMHVVKSLNDKTPNIWFAQDYNGGIWKLDFSFSHTSKTPEKIFSCHSGAVRGMDVSPISHLMATTGEDGTVRLYDLLDKSVLCEKKYMNEGRVVAWLPENINDKGDMFSIGFSDGILRILALQTVINNLNEPVVKFLLTDCLKPHSQAITSIVFFKSDNDYLLTGSEDKTVFIFTWSTYVIPIGFVSMPGPVTSLTCSPIKFSPKSILVTCASAEIVRFDLIEMNKKTLAALARKKTYSLDDECKLTICQAYGVKNTIKRQEYLLKKDKKKVEKASDEEEEEEEEEDVYVKSSNALGSILTGFCSQIEFKFWISMSDAEVGYLYRFDVIDDAESNFPFTPDPAGCFPLFDIELSPVQCIQFSPDGYNLVLGMQNGMIYIFKLSIPWSIDSWEYYWGERMHDSEYGKVTTLRFTPDQKFLISTGNDGNIFCFLFNNSNPTPGRKADIPENREEDELIEVNDISDPDYPNLEAERCKLEFNKLMKQVDKKKTIVLTQIRSLQMEFSKVLHANAALPQQMQIKREEIVSSKTLRKELIKGFDDMERQTRAELAWDAEKHFLALKKLEDRFKTGIKWDVLIVKAFNSAVTIATYRLAYLSDDIKQAMIDKDEKKPDTKSLRESQTEARSDITVKTQDITSEKQVITRISETFNLNIHVLRVLKRIEDRKRNRATRKAEWEELKSRKPDETKGDPAVQRALADAKNNQGDYNLKSSPEYVVPDHLRMTTKKKLKELVKSICMMFEYKEEFNIKVLKLRNDKKTIIKRIEWISERINSMQKTMQISEKKSVPKIPQMESYEIPEDILKSDLAKLIPPTDSGSTVGSGSDKPASKMPGMSRFRVSVVTAMLPASRARASVMLGRSPTLAATPRPSTCETESSDATDTDLHVTLASKTPMSHLEERLQKMTLRRNLHEQDELIIECDRIKEEFDQRLKNLQKEKCRLDVALKMGSSRQNLLYSELQLLAQFETEEEAMLSSINQTSEEKIDLQTKIQDLQIKIETRKREAERLKEQEKLLLHELFILLGEHNKFGPFLTKVYKKKVKRSKRKGTGAEGEEEEESSESDEDFEMDEEEDEDDEFVDDRECPEGCDIFLFNSILALRERRMDIEELLSEIRKHNEALRKETEAYNKKLKNIQTLLLVLQTDFKKIQREKQSRLNELFSLVPLKLNQMQYIVNNALPTDFSPCLIFPADALTRLEERIRELQRERIIQRQNQRKSKLHHSKLVKECQLMDKKISHLQTKCHELMIEKFGCVVDLDNLESLAVNKAVEEMKEKIKLYQKKFEKERMKWKRETEELEDEITRDVFNNTQRILGINEGVTELQSMEAQFMIHQKTLPMNLMLEKTPRQMEEDYLQKLVQCQEEEIELIQAKLKRAKSKSFCPSRELQLADYWECKWEKEEIFDETVTPQHERFDMKEFIRELFALDAKEEEAIKLSSDEEEVSSTNVLPLDLTLDQSDFQPSRETEIGYDDVAHA